MTDGIVITSVDITKTAVTEEELRVSEERFRSIFEQTSESIVLVDVKTGAFIEFNERAHTELGYSHAEFSKLTIFDLEADESSGKMAKHFKKVGDKGFELLETSQKTKIGKVVNTQVSSKAVIIRGEHVVQSLWWRY